MARSKGKSGGPAVVDVDPNAEQLDAGEQTQEFLDQEWTLLARDTRTPFFDALQDIPEGGWDKCSIYLYRLDPAVSNKSGEKKYIAVYGAPITEEGIKQEHGGGKYHAYLKYGKETLRNHRFSIEGQPIFIDGQTLRGGAAAVAPGTPSATLGANSEQLVMKLIEAVKGDPAAANAGLRVMEKAMTDGLALNSTILRSQLESTTGNKVSDKILDGLLPRLLAPPAQDPLVGQLLTAVLSMLTKERKAESNPAPAAAPVDPMSQFTFVKELLGVDSIKELFEQGGRSRNEPFWVSLVSNLVEKLPAVLHEFGDMQRQTFERALIAHQVRAGLPLTGTVLPAGTTVPIATAPPAQIQPNATAEQQQAQQMIAGIVDAICRAYDEGYPGDVAGAHLKLSYPQLVEQLKPMLADPQQLAAFVASIPALAERAAEVEWAEFQGELIAELQQTAIPPGAETPVQAQEVHTGGATPGAPPVVHVRPAKRKANGSAA